MFCSACGATVVEDAGFCARCGVKVGEGQPRYPVSTPDIGQDAGMRMLIPVGRTPLAFVAGYLGLFAVLCAPAPFALIVGILAAREIKRDLTGQKHGMGRAVFGIVMGGIFTLVGIFVLIMQLTHK